MMMIRERSKRKSDLHCLYRTSLILSWPRQGGRRKSHFLFPTLSPFFISTVCLFFSSFSPFFFYLDLFQHKYKNISVLFYLAFGAPLKLVWRINPTRVFHLPDSLLLYATLPVLSQRSGLQVSLFSFGVYCKGCFTLGLVHSAAALSYDMYSATCPHVPFCPFCPFVLCFILFPIFLCTCFHSIVTPHSVHLFFVYNQSLYSCPLLCSFACCLSVYPYLYSCSCCSSISFLIFFSAALMFLLILILSICLR